MKYLDEYPATAAAEKLAATVSRELSLMAMGDLEVYGGQVYHQQSIYRHRSDPPPEVELVHGPDTECASPRSRMIDRARDRLAAGRHLLLSFYMLRSTGCARPAQAQVEEGDVRIVCSPLDA